MEAPRRIGVREVPEMFLKFGWATVASALWTRDLALGAPIFTYAWAFVSIQSLPLAP